MAKRESRPIIQPEKFYSIVVHSSGAGEIEMTGVRDEARQDEELRTIFGTRPLEPGDPGYVESRLGDVATDVIQPEDEEF